MNYNMEEIADCCSPGSCITEELQVLEAIYIDELDISKNERGDPTSITVQLHPLTGDDHDKKYVCLTLVLTILPHYPNSLPEICIRNPRGLGEEEICSLQEEMEELAIERKGGEMLYELIEFAKESLTEGNVPKCACMICLEHFHEGEDFTKTECYHYFHSQCLSRYISHSWNSTRKKEITMPTNPLYKQTQKEKIVCPVCRKKIHVAYEEDMLCASSPSADTHPFIVTDSLRQWQKKMAGHLKYQEASGGIIDVDAEKTKFLVSPEDRILLREQDFNTNDDNSRKNDCRKSEVDEVGKYNNILTKHRNNSNRWHYKHEGWKDSRKYLSRKPDSALTEKELKEKTNNKREVEMELKKHPRKFSINKANSHKHWQHTDKSNYQSGAYRSNQDGRQNRNWRDQGKKQEISEHVAYTAKNGEKTQQQQSEDHCLHPSKTTKENFVNDDCDKSSCSLTSTSDSSTLVDGALKMIKPEKDGFQGKTERELVKSDKEMKEIGEGGKLCKTEILSDKKHTDNLEHCDKSPGDKSPEIKYSEKNDVSYRQDRQHYSTKHHERQRNMRYNADYQRRGDQNHYYKSDNYSNFNRPRSGPSKSTSYRRNNYQDVDTSSYRSLDWDKSTQNYKPKNNTTHYHRAQNVTRQERSFEMSNRPASAGTSHNRRKEEYHRPNIKDNVKEYHRPSFGNESQHRDDQRSSADSKSKYSRSDDKPLKQDESRSSTTKDSKTLCQSDIKSSEHENAVICDSTNKTGTGGSETNRDRCRRKEGGVKSRQGFPPVPRNTDKQNERQMDDFHTKKTSASSQQKEERYSEITHTNSVPSNGKNEILDDKIDSKSKDNSDKKDGSFIERKNLDGYRKAGGSKVKPPPGFENNAERGQKQRVNPPPGFSNL